MCGVRDERGKEVKEKRLWKVARMVEQIAVITEELADAIQHKARERLLKLLAPETLHAATEAGTRSSTDAELLERVRLLTA